MRQVHTMATAGLLLVTIFVVGIAATAFRPAAPVVLPESGQSEATVRTFFESVNLALRTGDRAPLHSFFADDFASHDRAATAPTSSGAFISQIVTIGRTFPGTQFVPSSISASGNLVFARVRIEGGTGGSLLGLALPATAMWGPLDVFRVQRSKISEHWGSTPVGFELSPASEAAFAVAKTSRFVLQFEEIALGAESSVATRAEQAPAIVRVVSGQVAVAVDPSSDGEAIATVTDLDGGWSIVTPGVHIALETGELIVLPVGASAEFSNWERSAATLVQLTLVRPVVGGVAQAQAGDPSSTALTRRVVASTPAVTLLPGWYQLEFGQLGLPAGAGIIQDQAAFPLLLLLAGGQVTVTTQGQGSAVSTGSGEIEGLGVASTGLQHRAILPANAVSTVQNTGTGPADLFLARVAPVVGEL
jgi:SnoaL-like polyketide cyclase